MPFNFELFGSDSKQEVSQRLWLFSLILHPVSREASEPNSRDNLNLLEYSECKVSVFTSQLWDFTRNLITLLLNSAVTLVKRDVYM